MKKIFSFFSLFGILFSLSIFISACFGVTTPSNQSQTPKILYQKSATGPYAEVIGCTDNTKNVEILSIYDNLPVKFIANEAFKNKDIESVIIPDSVTTIGDSAFASCDKLKSVTIGKGVEKIGSTAFSNCLLLEKINYQATSCEDSTFFTNAQQTAIFHNAGSQGNGITINISPNVQLIPAELFAGNHYSDSKYAPNITKVFFESGSTCESINAYAFSFCLSLKTINIPNSVRYIDRGAFFCCHSLNNISLPSNLSTIETSLFYRCTSLTRITIPTAVTKISNSAFYKCTSLTSITIHNNVNCIEKNAFADCDNLQNVFFQNTNGWSASNSYSTRNFKSSELSDNANAAYLLSDFYSDREWNQT